MGRLTFIGVVVGFLALPATAVGLIGESPTPAALPASTDTTSSIADQLSQVTPTDRVMVPEVRGMTVAEARAALSKAGLVLVDPAQGAGRIRRQNPLPGTTVPSRSRVTVTLVPSPTPPRGVAVPALVGLTVDAARATLDTVGLVLASGGAHDDRVTGQRPSPGTTAPRGSRVAVTVVSLVTVPDLAGLQVGEARARLKNVGLVLANEADNGRWIRSQNPPPRTRVDTGTAVHVTLVPPSRWWLVGVCIALLLAGWWAIRAARLRSARKWVDEHVSVVAQPANTDLDLRAVDGDRPVATWAVRLDPYRDAGSQLLEEVHQ